MSRLAQWITRNVGRIVDAVPDRPATEGSEPPTISSLLAEPPTAPSAQATPDWVRWMERVSAVEESARFLPACAEEGARLLDASGCEIWLAEGNASALAARWPQDGTPLGVGLGGEARSSLERGKAWRSHDRPGVAAAPLPRGSSGVSGWVVVGSPGPDLDRVLQFAAMVSSLLRFARRWSDERDAALRNREHVIARQVHRGLLPRAQPRHPALDVSGGVHGANGVGGCYYGFVSRPDGSLALTVVDVSSQGLDAALFLAGTKGAIESQVRGTPRPADLLSGVNDLLFAGTDPTGISATACHVVLEADGRRAVIANAGHVPPARIASDGEIGRLDRGGPALGLLGGNLYPQEEVSLRPGDVLLFFTEGLLQARGPANTPCGVERLVDRARRRRSASAKEIREAILEELHDHTGPNGQAGDFALVVVKVLAEAAESLG